MFTWLCMILTIALSILAFLELDCDKDNSLTNAKNALLVVVVRLRGGGPRAPERARAQGAVGARPGSNEGVVGVLLLTAREAGAAVLGGLLALPVAAARVRAERRGGDEHGGGDGEGELHG